VFSEAGEMILKIAHDSPRSMFLCSAFFPYLVYMLFLKTAKLLLVSGLKPY
jgi:hypothetical protein